jgi:hypothetical protein
MSVLLSPSSIKIIARNTSEKGTPKKTGKQEEYHSLGSDLNAIHEIQSDQVVMSWILASLSYEQYPCWLIRNSA